MSPAQLRHTFQDITRWANFRGVPLTLPPDHPRRTVDAMRLCVAAGPRLPELAHALFRANFVTGIDIADRVALDHIARDHGIDPAAIDNPEVKAELRAVTDEAVGSGAFGVPSFLVHDADPAAKPDLFLFGQDRLHFVERALDGWRPAS